MKTYLFTALFILATIALPDLAQAQTPFVQCGTVVDPLTGYVTNPCGSCEFVTMLNVILKWLIGFMFVLFVVLAFIAGIQLVTSGGNSGALDKAKSKFTNAFIGILIVLAAWILIDTIMRVLLVGGAGNINIAGYGFWAEVQCTSEVPPDPDTIVGTPPPLPPSCSDADIKANYNGSDVGVNHPGLAALMACYLADPTIAALKDSQPLYTHDLSHPKCALSNGYPVPACGINSCSHSQGSCHYGRGHGQGAMAFDINACAGNSSACLAQEKVLYDAVVARSSVCGGKIVPYAVHPNHTHVSMSGC